MPFLALVNVPGYLPVSDDRPLFDTAREAWEYLLDDRREAEDWQEDPAGYSATVNTLEQLSQGNFDPAFGVSDEDGTGVVYGATPGGAIHDLGLAYSVTLAEDDEEDAP